MKRLFFYGIFVLISLQTFAQQYFPSKAELKDFKRSKTYVLLDNNIFGTYNQEIRSAADKFWTITKHEYINKDGFNEKKYYPGASILFLSESYFDGQKDAGVFNTLSLNMGHESGEMDKMPTIVDFPLSYADFDTERYAYKIGLALKFMQNHIRWLMENPDIEDKSVLNYYRNIEEKTTDKTLYLLKEEMDKKVDELSEIKKVYSGKVKFVTREDIQEAVERGDENVLILNLVAPDQDVTNYLCLKMILGAADAKLYYFGFHKTVKRVKPGKFLKSDFQKINKFN